MSNTVSPSLSPSPTNEIYNKETLEQAKSSLKVSLENLLERLNSGSLEEHEIFCINDLLNNNSDIKYFTMGYYIYSKLNHSENDTEDKTDGLILN